MIKAIIFDCFGVLVTDALQAICDELRKHDPAAVDSIRSLVNASNRGETNPEDSSRQVATILGLKYEDYRKKVRDAEQKNEQLLALIKQLRTNYKTGLLSNIGKGSLARRFTEAELASHFDVVVASGDIGYAKPEARAYQITADKLGVMPNECVFTDDRVDFCDAAKAVGLQAIVYENYEQFKTDLELLLADSQ